MAIKRIVAILISGLLIACQPQFIQYRLGPDYSPLARLSPKQPLMALKVVDKRGTPSDPMTSGVKTQPRTELGDTLDQLIKQAAKENGIRLISNPLLADIALTLEIESFEVIVETGTLKSRIIVKAQTNMVLAKKSTSHSKRFITSRRQEVANPVTEKEVSGLVNQTLSEQFALMMQDPLWQQITL